MWYYIQVENGRSAIAAMWGDTNVYEGRRSIMDILKQLAQEQLRTDLPEIKIGDTLRVYIKVREGNRERVQMFEGTLIRKRHDSIQETFTVRRVSYGVGVEKTFPLNSPNIDRIEVVRHGKVRRAKLYYLRDRVGKAAKVKEKL